jgi:hypothetical protein
MKLLKLAVLPLLGLSLLATSALARDRVNVDINIGAYDYVAAPVVTHYPNTVYYGRTPTVIYYGAPTVVQYVPVVTTRYHQGHGGHYSSNYNYYQNWSQGWRGHGHHQYRHDGDRCERH